MELRSTHFPSDRALLTELELALEAENETLRTTNVTLKALILGARSERLSRLSAEQLALDLLDGGTEERDAEGGGGERRRSAMRGNRKGATQKAERNIGKLPPSI